MIEYNFLKSFIFCLVIGSLLHFTYNLSGQWKLVGYFSAVNESIWEHTKLATFPLFFYSFSIFLINKGELNNYFIALPIALIVATLTVPIVFYSYNKIFNTSFFIFDIGIFCLACYLGCTVFKYILSKPTQPLGISITGLVVTLIIFYCFFKWTYNPPSYRLFTQIGY